MKSPDEFVERVMARVAAEAASLHGAELLTRVEAALLAEATKTARVEAIAELHAGTACMESLRKAAEAMEAKAAAHLKLVKAISGNAPSPRWSCYRGSCGTRVPKRWLNMKSCAAVVAVLLLAGCVSPRGASVVVTWDNPTTDTDGQPIALRATHVLSGSASGRYSRKVVVPAPDNVAVVPLGWRTTHVAARAVGINGEVSDVSNEIKLRR